METEETMAIETAPLMFKTTVEKYGDRTAMRKKEYGLWRDISWNEYYEGASCLGAALISMGLDCGDWRFYHRGQLP